MDLETENRIAAILMKEAAELRRQAEEEGVLVYLRKPQVRGRPNSRFLTATVLANRAVEVNEMWRVRQKELELDDQLKGRSMDEGSSRSHRDFSNSSSCTNKRHATDLCSRKGGSEDRGYSKEDESLRDDEVEEFLSSRVKRGRGAVGSRMDEAGPYLPHYSDSKAGVLTTPDVRVREEWEHPEKLPSLESNESSEDELHREKKIRSGSLNKKHSRKHGSKEKSRDKEKKIISGSLNKKHGSKEKFRDKKESEKKKTNITSRLLTLRKKSRVLEIALCDTKNHCWLIRGRLYYICSICYCLKSYLG